MFREIIRFVLWVIGSIIIVVFGFIYFSVLVLKQDFSITTEPNPTTIYVTAPDSTKADSVYRLDIKIK